ncbi:PREDICTED: uncharacterized protein LOC108542806 [Rhinopithecus bieti]|uniref:uncharacterized protein LOC108542806 n=1 Tax=Rhinopithecus bieti TaxID=61621 RepID=UPI00083BFD9C|nr:PREDICTED: uncharacterized protein LOC108542806 [Rhinopithecus bieti]
MRIKPQRPRATRSYLGQPCGSPRTEETGETRERVAFSLFTHTNTHTHTQPLAGTVDTHLPSLLLRVILHPLGAASAVRALESKADPHTCPSGRKETRGEKVRRGRAKSDSCPNVPSWPACCATESEKRVSVYQKVTSTQPLSPTNLSTQGLATWLEVLGGIMKKSE